MTIAEYFGFFDDNQDTIDDYGEIVETAAEKQDKLEDAIKTSEDTLQKKLNVLRAVTAEQKYAAEQGRVLEQTEKDLIQNIEDFKKEKEDE